MENSNSNNISFPVPLIKCFVISEEGNSNLLQELLSAVEDSCNSHSQLLENFAVPINDLIVMFDKYPADPSLGGVTPPTLELPPMTSLETQFMSRIKLLQVANEDINRLIIKWAGPFYM